MHAICLNVSIKKILLLEDAVILCQCLCQPVCVCVCAVYLSLWLYMQRSVACSGALRGWWEPALIQACNLSELPPPPLHPCAYMAGAAHWDAGQTLQTRVCGSINRCTSFCSHCEKSNLGFLTLIQDYSHFNLPIHGLWPGILASLDRYKHVRDFPLAYPRYITTL